MTEKQDTYFDKVWYDDSIENSVATIFYFYIQRGKFICIFH